MCLCAWTPFSDSVEPVFFLFFHAGRGCVCFTMRRRTVGSGQLSSATNWWQNTALALILENKRIYHAHRKIHWNASFNDCQQSAGVMLFRRLSSISIYAAASSVLAVYLSNLLYEVSRQQKHTVSLFSIYAVMCLGFFFQWATNFLDVFVWVYVLHLSLVRSQTAAAVPWLPPYDMLDLYPSLINTSVYLLTQVVKVWLLC